MKLRIHINMLLALLILVSNTGLAFNVHYCEGRISGISFSYQQDEPCVRETPCEEIVEKSCCAVAKKHDSCCENSKVNIKKTATENVIIKAFQLDLMPFVQQDSWNETFNQITSKTCIERQEPAYYCDTNAPPFYKLYSQFIFYDSVIS